MNSQNQRLLEPPLAPGRESGYRNLLDCLFIEAELPPMLRRRSRIRVCWEDPPTQWDVELKQGATRTL